jgi:hypothetical protein
MTCPYIFDFLDYFYPTLRFFGHPPLAYYLQNDRGDEILTPFDFVSMAQE